MINKEIFFFWANPTMSWMRYMTLKSFRQQNPNWKITLYVAPCNTVEKPWDDHNNQDFFNFDGKDYMPRVPELDVKIKSWHHSDILPDISSSHTSNFFKWYTLATEGGIYADMDILWFKPFDEFYNQIVNMDVGICATKFFSIGLLTASPQNAVYEKIYKVAFETYTQRIYQSAGVLALYVWLYGPQILEHEYKIWGALGDKVNIFKDLQATYPSLKMFNIPMNLIYPLDCNHIDKIFQQKVTLPEESIGLHWYAGHPIAQDANNLLTEENYKEYSCTFTEYIND